MGTLVHDYRAIGSRMLGDNKPRREPPCLNCNGAGWVDGHFMFCVDKIVCAVCGNPKGHPKP